MSRCFLRAWRPWSLGVLGVMGAMLSITGIFGMAAYSVSRRLKELGIRMALGAQTEGSAAGRTGTRLQIAGYWFRGGIGPRNSGEPGCWLHRLSGNSPRSAGAGRRGSRDALLGLVATWIPAQRALSIDPLTLLREE